MTIDPKLTQGAIDLDEARVKQQREKEQKEAEAELREKLQQQAIQQQAAAWERQMKRTFKGIFRHSDRVRFLRSSMGEESA